jgi:hypothetical protein
MRDAIQGLVEEFRRCMQPGKDDAIIIPGHGECKIAIDGFQTLKEFFSSKSAGFVDGGNAEILGNASFSSQFIRTLGIIMKAGRTTCIRKCEFLSSTRTIDKDGMPFYHTTSIPLLGESMPADTYFAASDELSVKELGSLARRLSELKTAGLLIEDLQEGDMLVLDGTLESKTVHEEKALCELILHAMKKNILLCAVAKTTTLLTKGGMPASQALLALGGNQMWHYKVARIDKESHHAIIHFARLHGLSRLAFRIEFPLYAELMQTDKVIGSIAYYAKDLSFPGYPYGLIKADLLARVPEKEAQGLRSRIGAFLGKEMTAHASSLGAHDLLDSSHR